MATTPPLDPGAAEALDRAPMPTPKTLKRRKNVFLQFGRFIAINMRMLRVIRASGHK